MDTLIKDGDFFLDACGLPKSICGGEEACQRVRLILSVQKGSFIYDRNFGADWQALVGCENIEKTAGLIVREALVNEKEIAVGEVKVNRNENVLLLDIEVIYNGESYRTEVSRSAKL